jgi:HK97 family phage prohead protease
MSKKKYDFSGYATKTNLVCADGRVILRDAFKDQHGKTVPLVWQHLHNEPNNILGHAVLENREDGVYCYGEFNDTESGKNAKQLVAHGDICSLSIYANQLKEQAKKVMHGAIREVSLVLSGANPGALIDNISFSHSDGSYTEDETEALIYTGLEFEKEQPIAHSIDKETIAIEEKPIIEQKVESPIIKSTDNGGIAQMEGTKEIKHAAAEDATVQDVLDSFSAEQKDVLYYLIGEALDNAGSDEATHSNINEKGETIMKTNVFDQTTQDEAQNVLSHEQIGAILGDAKRFGSLKESFIAHAEEYGFDPIDILFPDAKDVDPGGPTTIKRNDAWVADVLGNTNHTPFSRIRTRFADITLDDARAKGYVTGEKKKEEIIPLTKRITTPTTIYKKQKLDRDDMVDITDFDVVVWLKKEMRGMLDEELARAILIGDGRIVGDEDKINESNIRPISLDDDSVFVHRVPVAFELTADEIIDEFIKARKAYKGSGVPSLYVSTDLLTDMLLIKDKQGHRMYKTNQELASVLRVSNIIEVEPMNEAVHTVGEVDRPILGIVVNLKDYTIGADKGGQVGMFDDFDIDYNQYKYLIETRVSGALTKPKSAIVIEQLPAEE